MSSHSGRVWQEARQGLGTGCLRGLSLSPAGVPLTLLWPRNSPHTKSSSFEPFDPPWLGLNRQQPVEPSRQEMAEEPHGHGWLGDRERGLPCLSKHPGLRHPPRAQQQGLASPRAPLLGTTEL